jgi:predicted 3-demethylubiquinone-9 3-methyltransferase (glyoxalase superfamily)
MSKLETNQKIMPFLWFDKEAEEAAKFYTGIFPNSKILSISHYGEGAPAPKGSVMSVNFVLDGLKFGALNAGPHFKFNPAVSFFISCESQKEIDFFWKKLCEGGQEGQCGWLTDKFGLSWQVVPSNLGELLHGKKAGKGKEVMNAMMQMKKLDMNVLEEAAI